MRERESDEDERCQHLACVFRTRAARSSGLAGKQCIISNPPSASEGRGGGRCSIRTSKPRSKCGFQPNRVFGVLPHPASTRLRTSPRARPDVPTTGGPPTGAVPATAHTRGRAPARRPVRRRPNRSNRTAPRELTSNVNVLWAFFFHGATRRFRRHLPSTRPHERPRTSSERESES